jgi:acetoin:2,6-dichlorophenolindophenol oxidoreductase subunit beta
MSEERILTMGAAIREALHYEMERDSTVIVMGEDVVGGAGSKVPDAEDCWGGPFGITGGLVGKYGRNRVRDTPISEAGFVGAAIGAAATGLRPVVSLMFVDFFGIAMDQIFNQGAKLRYMFGGKAKVPVVIRAAIGGGINAAAQHSQVLYSIFTHIPGLKVVVPSTPYDAKGLMTAAIRDDDLVFFLEHKRLMGSRGHVPEEPYIVPLGEASIRREGSDVTVVAIAKMVDLALSASDALAAEGISVEVIDPRSLSPLDGQTIVESVEKTGRLVVVDEDTPRCNLATDIAALVADEAFYSLEAPIKRVTPPHTPVPFSPALEGAYIPTQERVVAAIREVMSA